MKKCYLMLISVIFIISFGNQAVAMHRVLQAVQSPTGCCLVGSGCGLLSWWTQRQVANNQTGRLSAAEASRLDEISYVSRIVAMRCAIRVSVVAMHRVLSPVAGYCLVGSIGCGVFSRLAQQGAAIYYQQGRDLIKAANEYKNECYRSNYFIGYEEKMAQYQGSINDYGSKVGFFNRVSSCLRLVAYASAIYPAIQLVRKIVNR